MVKAARLKKATTFVVDCSKPVDDKIMEIASFEKFLQVRPWTWSSMVSVLRLLRADCRTCRTGVALPRFERHPNGVWRLRASAGSSGVRSGFCWAQGIQCTVRTRAAAARGGNVSPVFLATLSAGSDAWLRGGWRPGSRRGRTAAAQDVHGVCRWWFELGGGYHCRHGAGLVQDRLRGAGFCGLRRWAESSREEALGRVGGTVCRWTGTAAATVRLTVSGSRG